MNHLNNIPLHHKEEFSRLIDEHYDFHIGKNPNWTIEREEHREWWMQLLKNAFNEKCSNFKSYKQLKIYIKKTYN